MLEGILAGTGAVLSLWGLVYLAAGIIFGILVGVLPGVGPALGMALLIPFTYDIGAANAMILLISVYVGAEYGGSITSILIAVPGNGAAAATVLDGYPMARKGLAGKALEISLTASCLGGVLGGLCLLLLLHPLAGFALAFGPAAYFAAAILALTSVGALGGGAPLLGLLSATLGMCIALIGVDPITSVPRFTFGLHELEEGVPVIVAIIGLFAVTEMLELLAPHAKQSVIGGKVKSVYLSLADWCRLLPSMLRGSAIGVSTGVLPGLGATIGAWIAYDAERRLSRTPEAFGNGAEEGVSAPEAANNSAVGGQLIPLLALGLPSSASTAVLAGALVLHGLQPGPRMITGAPEVAYGIIVTVIFSVIALYLLGRMLVPLWVAVTRAPESVMIAGVLTLSLIGAYTVRNLVFDMGLVLVFGVLGWLMKLARIPVPPLILALVIFELVEGNFRRALMLSRGDLAIFVGDPISITFLSLAALVVLAPLFGALRRLKKHPKNGAQG